MLFNPTPIAHALAQQSRLNADIAQREAERDRRQAEWNALHYELLQRMALEVSRVGIEAQSLSMRVESLGAKVDFNERRVRTMEGTQGRPPRQHDSTPAAQQPAAVAASAMPTDTAPQQSPSAEGQPAGEAPRRRRRRRRGRRGPGAGAPADATTAGTAAAASAVDTEDNDSEGDEAFEEEHAAPEPVALDHRLPAADAPREEPPAAPEPVRAEEPTPPAPEE